MDTVRRGYNFNYAPVLTAHKDIRSPFAILSEGSVVLETVKHGEDNGIILRLYEAIGATSSLTLDAQGKQIVLTNILEDEIENLGMDKVELIFSPFEIKTIKIK